MWVKEPEHITFIEHLNNNKINYSYLKNHRTFHLHDLNEFVSIVDNKREAASGIAKLEEKFKVYDQSRKVSVITKRDMIKYGHKPKANTYETTILNKKIKFVLYSNSQYIKEFGSGTEAEFDPKERTVHINIKFLTFETVAHEIGHVFFQFVDKNVVQMKDEQIEEFYTEVISTNLFTFNSICFNVYSELLYIAGRILKKEQPFVMNSKVYTDENVKRLFELFSELDRGSNNE
jgi:hypothetical protein